jgi:hypothetical protein
MHHLSWSSFPFLTCGVHLETRRLGSLATKDEIYPPGSDCPRRACYCPSESHSRCTHARGKCKRQRVPIPSGAIPSSPCCRQSTGRLLPIQYLCYFAKTVLVRDASAAKWDDRLEPSHRPSMFRRESPVETDRPGTRRN